MNNFRIGQLVTRTDSQAYGLRGTVVEINVAGRVRVAWPHYHAPRTGIMRTWVSPLIITDSENLTDAQIAAHKQAARANYKRRIVPVPKPIVKRIEKPLEIGTARFMVMMTEPHTGPDCWNITDTTTGQRLLPEDAMLHYCLRQAERLERSKRPEKMIERIIAEDFADV